jgi:hypothetical protein
MTADRQASARSLPFTVIHLCDPAVRELYGAEAGYLPVPLDE